MYPPEEGKIESWSWRMNGPRLMMQWMTRRHFRATIEFPVRRRRSIRAEMRVEAVAREASPRVRRAEMRWSSGGEEGEWVVERTTASLMAEELDSKAALEREALSLIRFTRSRSLIVFPIGGIGEEEDEVEEKNKIMNMIDQTFRGIILNFKF